MKVGWRRGSGRGEHLAILARVSVCVRACVCVPVIFCSAVLGDSSTCFRSFVGVCLSHLPLFTLATLGARNEGDGNALQQTLDKTGISWCEKDWSSHLHGDFQTSKFCRLEQHHFVSLSVTNTPLEELVDLTYKVTHKTNVINFKNLNTIARVSIKSFVFS